MMSVHRCWLQVEGGHLLLLFHRNIARIIVVKSRHVEVDVEIITSHKFARGAFSVIFPSGLIFLSSLVAEACPFSCPASVISLRDAAQ